ncbi:MAG: DUF4912 domain-containing protein [Leptodesmis sp.]|uniref:DUF4912 domain-containing protein n=1 Tax=Leptodesmis sp. TaxID=3100501 RepID=UPI003D14DB0E
MSNRPPLEEMTLRQLRRVASECGVSRYSRMRKDQLLAAIQEIQMRQQGGTAPVQELVAQELVEAAKFDVGQDDRTGGTLAAVDEGLPELPDGYGDCRIVLMPRDPQWAYAYWDITNEAKEVLRQQGGQQLALRIYDVTDINLAFQSPHSVQEYPCDELAREWYLPIPVSDRDYVVDIGYRCLDGRWLLLARSATVRIPPIYPSDWIEDHFLTISWEDSLEGQTFATLVPPSRRMAVEPVYDEMYELAEAAEAERAAGSLYGSMQQVPGSVAGSLQHVAGSGQQAVSSYVLASGAGIWASGVPTTESGVGMTMSGVGLTEFGVGITQSGVGMTQSGVGLGMSGVGMTMSGVGLTQSGVGMTESGVGMGYTMSGVGMSGVGLTTSGVGIGATMSGVGMTMSGVGLTQSGVGLTMSGVGLTQSGVGMTESGVGMGYTMSGVGMSGIGMGYTMSGVGLTQSGVGLTMSGVGLTQSGVGMTESGVGMGYTMSGVGMSGVGMTMSGVGMSGVGFSGSLPIVRPRKFWLVADAELIVYGATEPDAIVTIGGRPIKLNPDGTFRFRMSFQDGLIDYPIMAVAADGEQMRSIHMKFNRETPERHTNTKDEAVEEWLA